MSYKSQTASQIAGLGNVLEKTMPTIGVLILGGEDLRKRSGDVPLAT